LIELLLWQVKHYRKGLSIISVIFYKKDKADCNRRLLTGNKQKGRKENE